jgi:hypoxanthine phosphoribosyltransferase
MHGDVERVLIPQAKIAERVRELAGQITADHGPGGLPDNGQVTIIPILTGAMIFTADLIRQLPMRMKIGLLAISSYPGQSTSAGPIGVVSQKTGDLRGRHVLIIDDVLDSGGTIRHVRTMLGDLGPASVKVCVLLRKPTQGARRTPVDYVGFDIPDEFVVGYGLDFDDHYRNLPDIVTLKRDVIAAGSKP